MNTIQLKRTPQGMLFAAGGVLVVLSILFAGATSAHAQITRSLDLGDADEQVTALQRFLANDPSLYPEGLVTGYFGPLTQAAVQRYQAQNGIVSSGTPQTTGYGRVGPQTMASINSQWNSIGGPDTGGPDVWAPVINGVDEFMLSDTSAMVQWWTDEPVTGRVMYVDTYPFLLADAPSVSVNEATTSPSVTIQGLVPDDIYFYVIESVDRSGNIQRTTGRILD